MPSLRPFYLAVLVAWAAAACGPTAADNGDGGAGGGDAGLAGDSGRTDSGNPDPGPTDQCPDEAKLIYVVSQSYRFAQFDPRPDPPVFNVIGDLDCPAGGATPWSMSVDRTARAWVLYSSGKIYWVDTKTAACSDSGYVANQQGYDHFGMGFVSNTPGSADETLFVSAEKSGLSTTYALGTIDTTTLALGIIAPIPGATYMAELTGSGSGRLWGFYPIATTPRIAEFDKTTGVEIAEFPLTLGPVGDFAFAYWNGSFWVFLGANVYKVSQANGSMTQVLSNQEPTVGAGVSTCAPWVD
jgi:hypothetical protein